MKSKEDSKFPDITYITKSTVIVADIECDDDIRIAGSIEGELESKKKVILTDSGKIKGTISAPHADISGEVIGDVRASEKIVLRPTALVEGKIFTKKLSIEDGAQLKGSFEVGPDVKVNKDTSKSSPLPKPKKELPDKSAS